MTKIDPFILRRFMDSTDVKNNTLDVVYLNLQSDPLTTMTIQFHTINKSNPSSKIFYRKEDINGTWKESTGDFRDAAATGKKRKIHWVEITDLEPDTVYQFKIEEDEVNITRKFKTFPSDLTNGRTLKLAHASDPHFKHSMTEPFQYFEPICDAMGGKNEDGFDADIIIGGGDYTIDDGREGLEYTIAWIEFLKTIQDKFVSSDGCMIPFVPVVGNHDTRRQKDDEVGLGNSANYERMFAFPTQDINEVDLAGYGHLEFGDYLQLLILDSGWLSGDSGKNRVFVEEYIDDSKTHIIPINHVPMYSFREGNYTQQQALINAYEQTLINNNVKLSLAGHNHNYKRTEPLIDGEIDSENGIIHMGDGGWGHSRSLSDPNDLYIPDQIVKVAYENYESQDAGHFIGVEIHEDKLNVKSINTANIIFDEIDIIV